MFKLINTVGFIFLCNFATCMKILDSVYELCKPVLGWVTLSCSAAGEPLPTALIYAEIIVVYKVISQED